MNWLDWLQTIKYGFIPEPKEELDWKTVKAIWWVKSCLLELWVSESALMVNSLNSWMEIEVSRDWKISYVKK